MTAAPRRVVSVTPLSVDRDSRTLKVAMSFASWGWDSKIVEGYRSVHLPAGLPVSVDPARDKGKGASGQVTVGRMAPIFQSANPLISLPLACAFGLRFMLHHRWQTSRRIPDADLYYLHSFEDFGSVWRAARRCGARIIYDAHDFYSGIIPRADMPPYRRHYVQAVLEWLEQRCVNKADAVITVGEGVAELMTARFGRKPSIVRNAHDSRLDTTPPEGLRDRLGLAPSDMVLVTVGNRKIGQAVNEAVAALGLLPSHVHLVLVGAGYESALEEAEMAGVAGRVHVVPPVSPTEIVPLICEADVGLVLYWDYSENFRHALPNGFFQVVAAGLPLVHGGLPEITRVSQKAGTGVGVNLQDPAAIAGVIVGWLQDPARLAAERSRAARAAAELTWVHEEKTLIQVLETIGLGTVRRSSVRHPVTQE